MEKITSYELKQNREERREFIKKIVVFGSIMSFGLGTVIQGSEASINNSEWYNLNHKYSSISIEHIKEMREWINKLKAEGKLSSNETYRSYIDFDFDYQKTMPDAKSIIIVARKQRIASLIFNKNGKLYELLIPTGYVTDGLDMEKLKKWVQEEIIKVPNKKLDFTGGLPAKTLAVHSGLAQYGLNNISFIDGYGSFHQLINLYTDHKLDDNWSPLKTMRICKGCSICKKGCPTNCITEENFVIDVGKCITLYNELSKDFPEWLDKKAHHSLVGCFKCQWDCPANSERIKDIEKLVEFNEKETDLILSDRKDEVLQKVIIEKLKDRFPSVENFAYFRRNSSMALNNIIDS